MKPPLRLFALVVVLCWLSSACGAQSDPQALVKQMVQHELSSQQTQNYWMYIDTDKEDGATKVNRVVETPACWFKWLLSVNGGPPSPAQQQQQRQKVERLVDSPEARHQNRAEIEADGTKAEALVRQLPNMFLYTDDGQENGFTRLKFRPNPKYDPPTKAARVFHNMAGTILIDPKEVRLAGISGTLQSDVTFGWGILGRLHKGGTFNVVQTQLAPGDWEVTLLDVHIYGQALFFKTISEDQHEVKTEFQHLPKDLQLAKAAQLAEHGPDS
jgi:hypothetical protein